MEHIIYQKVNDLLMLLCRTISTRKLYFADHPQVKQQVADFIQRLDGLCRQRECDQLFIGIVEGNFVFAGKNMVGPSIAGKHLVMLTKNLNCGGIVFHRETSEGELNTFLGLASELKQPVDHLTSARKMLKSRGIDHIEIASHYSGKPGADSLSQHQIWEGQDRRRTYNSPTLIYQALFDVVARAHGNVAMGREVDIDATRSVSEYMLQFARNNFSDLMQHVYYPDYNSYTVGHSVRVAALAVFFATSCGWDKATLLSLATAGLLHDVGKSKIPDELLYKTGSLTDDEFEIVKEHSQMGAEILLGQKNSSTFDIASAWGHHFREDGAGYPDQPEWVVKHPMISLLRICDAFEALTASRPYKNPLSPHMAFCIMLSDKGGYHPNLLASFISAIGIYPPGNIVRMADGRLGTVMGVGDKIDRPQVQISHRASGEVIPGKDQYTIDLSSEKYQSITIKELLLEDNGSK